MTLEKLVVHLHMGNNTNLTSREIEVIACLLHDKSTKKIASFLSISPRTVETHLRNIMLKLGCRSQESIIEFIEKNGKLAIYKQYYLYLSLQLRFEMELRNIYSLAKGVVETCIFIPSKAKSFHPEVIANLENHLNLAGIKLIYSDPNELHQSQSHQKNSKYKNCIVNFDHLIKQLANQDANPIDDHLTFLNNVNEAENLIFIGNDIASFKELLSKSLDFDHVKIIEAQNYYFLVFEILAKLLPHVNLKDIFSKFRKQYTLIQNSELSKVEIHKTETHKTEILNAEKYKNNLKSNNVISNSAFTKSIGMFNLKNIRSQLLLSSIFIIFIAFLSIYFFIPNIKLNGKNNSQYLSTQKMEGGQHNSSMSFISDLISLKQPQWNVPKQEHLFVGRNELLKKLSSILKPKQVSKELPREKDIMLNSVSENSVFSVCTGLGGIGKTQLVLNYAQNTKSAYLFKAWFPAENIDQLNLKYIEFAKVLGYQGNQFSLKNIISYVNQWLSEHPNWLIIFDNVNSYEEISPYLPEKGGYILITSRSQLWPSHFHIVPVNLLTEEESISLLTQLARMDSIKKENNELKTLARTLGYLPLALTQAGAYIFHNQISISEYLELYKKYSKDLLNDKNLNLGSHNIPISTTWNISLESILKNTANRNDAILALNLLTACSYLSSENIPRFLLLEWIKQTHPKLANPEIVLNKALSLLWQYSLITTDEIGIIGVHRLLQLAVRNQNITSLKLAKNWYYSLLEAVHHEFKRETLAIEDENRRKILLPHLQSLLHHSDSIWPKGNPGLILENILQDIAFVLDSDQCDFKSATPYYERSLKICENKFYPNDPRIANALIGLAHNYRNLRDYEKARAHLERALAIFEQKPDDHQLQIMNALTTLGNTYRNLKEYTKSRDALERSIMLCEKNYGNKHHKLAYILSSLGNTYRNLKDFKKSLEVQERALEISKREYGLNHRDTIPTLVNLGATYRDMGNFEKAQSYLEPALTFYQEMYGEEHAYVAIASMNLGELYYSQGNMEKARTLLERALKIHVKEYGNNHPHTLYTVMFLEKVNNVNKINKVNRNIKKRKRSATQV